jgi:inner membrane protease subunit 2
MLWHENPSTPSVSTSSGLVLVEMSSNRVLGKLKGRLPFSPFVRDFAWYSFVIASWVPALIFFNANVGEVAGVGGESMYPYLNPAFHAGLSRDICWISKRHPAKDLQRGMIVTFW